MSDAVLLTGATGYIGGYVACNLLERYPQQRLALLVRARDRQHAEQRLWRGWQLHLEFKQFLQLVRDRCEIVLGDLTAPDLGLDTARRRQLAGSVESIIHCAASLNRRSNKACFNVNLRGTLSLLQLAREIQAHHGLRRFSDVSTVAVAGHRQGEVVSEDDAVDWQRSDYDPYARTKKFCEHMVHELLPDVDRVVFRPSIVLGDSRFPETTQFDMAGALVLLAHLPLLPFPPEHRLDIISADYVGDAIATIHQRPTLAHDTYHLSAGFGSPTYREVRNALRAAGHRLSGLFTPALAAPFDAGVGLLAASPRRLGVAKIAAMMKVFLPYLRYDTVFDNQRVVDELGRPPERFTRYAYRLLRFAVHNRMRYPHRPWPADTPPPPAELETAAPPAVSEARATR